MINISVQASVFNISSVSPSPEDEYLVDTNVWYWMTYSKASILSPVRQANDRSFKYPGFLKKALQVGATLHRCDLSFPELCHAIEKCEKEIYEEYIVKGKLGIKEYRHSDEEERGRTVTEIESAWSQVCSMSTCRVVTVGESATVAALKDIKNYPMDGYDALILEAMRSNDLTKIITDDCDFGEVAGIEVYTGNSNLIENARNRGRLTE